MAARDTTPQRLLAAAVYLPIGLGAAAVEELPDLVARARRELVVARFFGKMAVDRGVQDLQRRLRADDAPSSRTPRTGVAPPESPGRPSESTADAGVPSGGRAAPAVPTAEELALPDYDQLPAAHILGKLGGLTSDEREAIERYETAHRHRRTVIGKIEQLRTTGTDS